LENRVQKTPENARPHRQTLETRAFKLSVPKIRIRPMENHRPASLASAGF
jgi:hypothetical protein